MRKLEKMQLKICIRGPGDVTSWVNQVSVQYDLYDRIKEAQHKDDELRKILENVQDGKIQGFTCDEGVLKFGHRVCVPQDKT